MKTNKKIQKRTLVKLIREGKVEAKCEYSMTDDYAYDNANSFGRTDWMPACILEDNDFSMSRNSQGEYKKYSHKSGFINFYQEYLASNSDTRLYYTISHTKECPEGREVLVLRIHSNKSYELRIKE